MPIINLFAEIFVCYLAYKGWLKLRELFSRKNEFFNLGKETISDYIQEEIRKGVAAELDRRDKEGK